MRAGRRLRWVQALMVLAMLAATGAHAMVDPASQPVGSSAAAAQDSERFSSGAEADPFASRVSTWLIAQAFSLQPDLVRAASEGRLGDTRPAPVELVVTAADDEPELPESPLPVDPVAALSDILGAASKTTPTPTTPEDRVIDNQQSGQAQQVSMEPADEGRRETPAPAEEVEGGLESDEASVPESVQLFVGSNVLPVQPAASSQAEPEPVRVLPAEKGAAPAAATPVAAHGEEDWVVTGALVAAAGAAAALTVSLLVRSSVAAAMFRVLRSAPFLAPLFSRVSQANALDHPGRTRLLSCIAEHPGITLGDLCELADLKEGTVRYHTKVLERQGYIQSRTFGRSRHFFDRRGGQAAPEETQAAYAILHGDRYRQVSAFVRQTPGSIQKEVCQELQLTPPQAHECLKRLEGAGLIHAIRQGRTVHYFPTDSLQVVATASPPSSAAVWAS